VLTKPLHDFAQWAFGPTGFPSLRVIAFGDFSYEGRFPLDNLFLCRNIMSAQLSQNADAGSNFHQLTREDPMWKDLLNKYYDFLQACPDRPIVQGLTEGSAVIRLDFVHRLICVSVEFTELKNKCIGRAT
jgi:hypothetical protein